MTAATATTEVPDLPTQDGFGTSAGPADITVAHVPRIEIHAYFESDGVGALIGRAGGDRRMMRAQLDVRGGGISAAIDAYKSASTPDLLILQVCGEPAEILSDIDRLAEVCDAATKVLVIGSSNDVRLYRDLISRGVSDYLHESEPPMQVVAAVARLFQSPSARRIAKIHAFIGAKGGAGSSTVAHSTAWSLAQQGAEVILVDFDLAFGTAALDFNLDPEVGSHDALREASSLDDQMLERLLTPCGPRLRLLAAPAMLDASGDVPPEAIDRILEVLRQSAAHVVLDLPHVWSPWVKRALIAAEEVVITAAPDLGSLRNGWELCESLKKSRPGEAAPHLVLNQVGLPKRREIPAETFVETLGLEPALVLQFDGQAFGKASNEGHVVAAESSRLRTSFERLAAALSGAEQERKRTGGLGRFWKRLGGKK